MAGKRVVFLVVLGLYTITGTITGCGGAKEGEKKKGAAPPLASEAPPATERKKERRRWDELVERGFDYFKRNTAAWQLFQKTFDGKIKVEADTNVSTGVWNPEKMTIFINPYNLGENDAMIAATILFELLNAIRNEQFTTANNKAAAGEVNRINYVLKIEYGEFHSYLQLIKMVKDAIQANEWDAKAAYNTKEWEKMPPTFNEFLILQIDSTPSHAGDIGKTWDKDYSSTWVRDHPGKSPDIPDPGLIRTMMVDKTTLTALRKKLQR